MVSNTPSPTEPQRCWFDTAVDYRKYINLLKKVRNPPKGNYENQPFKVFKEAFDEEGSAGGNASFLSTVRRRAISDNPKDAVNTNNPQIKYLNKALQKLYSESWRATPKGPFIRFEQKTWITKNVTPKVTPKAIPKKASVSVTSKKVKKPTTQSAPTKSCRPCGKV